MFSKQNRITCYFNESGRKYLLGPGNILHINTGLENIKESHPNFNDYLLAVLFGIYFMPPPSPPQGGSQWSSK
jgi:hypothetical protein